ncbi:MAG: response regulator [Patescibacteria group bacterium]|nr:response regulator [Patescibacteria group bacterium]
MADNSLNPKIMIVDDDQRLLTLYEATLKSQGYRVVTASNGEQALSDIIREKPDLVILDIMMPKLHGINVLDILKATPDVADTKVVILTALSDESMKNKALELGASDFIVKSETNMADLLSRVSKALNPR